MITFLLLLATFAPSQSAHVDVVEVNHFHNTNCDYVFTQLIFYSWSAQLKRHNVREWRLVKSDSMQPRPHGNRWLVRWHDDGVLREVIASSRRETWTQYDPELKERGKLHETERLPLWSETK